MCLNGAYRKPMVGVLLQQDTDKRLGGVGDAAPMLQRERNLSLTHAADKLVVKLLGCNVRLVGYELRINRNITKRIMVPGPWTSGAR
jgi:hypothetical protein